MTQVDQVRNTFDALDTSHVGYLHPKELKEGLKQLSLPYTEEDVVGLIKSIDQNGDGIVSFEEFKDFVTKRDAKLRALFEEVDLNHNGLIEYAEVVKALEKLGMEHDDAAVSRLMKRVDSNNDGVIDYDEWKRLLVMVPQATMDAAFGYWQRAAVLVVDDDVSLPASEATKGKSLVNFVAGATAAVCSKTGTAPLERLKIMFQVSQSRPPGIGAALRGIYATEGVAGLFRGNFVNILKSSPESAVKFMVFERTKRMFGDNDLSSLQLFAAGSAGGVGAHASCYPLEVIKTRLCAAPTGTYNGAMDCVRKIVANEGLIRPFYRGLPVVIMTTIPHSGTTLMTYELAKNFVTRLHPDTQPGVVALMGAATASSLCGQLVSYPLHVLKARLIMQGSHGPGEHHYTGGAWSVFRQVLQKEGADALLRGFVPSLAKGVPSHCITYVVYEYFRRFWGIEKKHHKKSKHAVAA